METLTVLNVRSQDLVNHRQLALEYNVQVANEVARLINQMPA